MTIAQAQGGAEPGWDIFCRVVDNYGDIGVCWRLATQLAGRGLAVRLFTDDADPLAWMAPHGCPGVTVVPGLDPPSYEPAGVVVDAFGANLGGAVVEAVARSNREGPHAVAWINLEYLSAEPYVARSHGLASPVHGGAAAGIRKWFYFPGFTGDTGGLLREPDLVARQARFRREEWLAAMGAAPCGQQIISLFCYEPEVLAPWLGSLASAARDCPVDVLVTHGRAQAAVRAAQAQLPARWNAHKRVRLLPLPALPQVEFDHLLWSADLNFVRGEDSLVRALWAGRPFVWQIYPQDDGAHAAKLEAFLDVLAGTAAPALRGVFRWWNGLAPGPAPAFDADAWQAVYTAARLRLLAQTDLVTRLLRFVAENR